MIAYLNLIILALVPALSVFQRTRGSFLLTVAYSIVLWAFVLYEPYIIEGYLYYLCAAASDAFMVYLAGVVQPIRLFNIRLQRAAILSVCVNMLGFILWYNYQPSDLYALGIAIAHGYLVLAIIRGDSNAYGDDKHSTVRDTISFDFRSCFVAIHTRRKGL